MENVKQAVKVLGIYTAGRFDIWALAGSARAGCRAHVLAALRGVDRVPQREAGVTALRDAFFAAMKPAGDCLAIREDNFIAACRAIAKAEGRS
jgi:hypothetical protein